jgi:hypothetical protein
MRKNAPDPGLALGPVIERAKRETGAGSECHPDGSLWRLCIWGWFPPDWCGSLSLHCYAARLSVLEAEACRVRTALWAGAFRLAPQQSDRTPRAHDFVHMARRRPLRVARPGDIAVDDVRIEPAARDGTVRVRVAGPDRIGFLAVVLDPLAGCGLYPLRLSVRTSAAGRAEDCFDVQGVGGAPPAPRALASLEKRLLAPRQPMRAL